MTFNKNARINTGGVRKRSGGKGGIMAGGSLGLIALLFIGSQILGVNLMPFADLASGGSGGGGAVQNSQLEECETGADANTNDECRMAGAADALDQYWSTEVGNYRSPQLYLFSGTTQTECGTASAQTGPFYCPPEEAIYVDTAFFATLSDDYGASTGPLAQMYVLSHEWGHHVSQLTGQLQQVDNSTGADSGSVRLELQADCFAGAWVKNATSATDEYGVPLLQPVTQSQLDDAMSAAAAIGDDHIMENAGIDVNPDRFTHGTSEQRQRWLQTGYEQGPNTCGTFDVSADSL